MGNCVIPDLSCQHGGLLVGEGGALEGGNCLHLPPGGPAEVALWEERGQRGPQQVGVWLLCGGHQRDGEELEGGSGGLGRKLHPGATAGSGSCSSHSGHPGGHGDHPGDIVWLGDHAGGLVEVLKARPLLGRRGGAVSTLLVLLPHLPDGLADLSLLVGFEEGQVVGRVCHCTDGGHWEELEGRGREARRGA